MDEKDLSVQNVDDLKKEIDRHKRAREREKKARLRAEELLEVKSRELFYANEELKQAEVNYRSIFENAMEGIYQTKPDGQYLRANPMLMKIRGYESFETLSAEMQNAQAEFYVDRERRKTFMDILENKGQVNAFESEIRQKDGQLRWISENARVVRDDAGQTLYYEGTMQDITQRRQAQLALQKSKEELELANQQLKQTQTQMVHQEKMAGLGQLAAGVAHEINNPVGFIMSNLGTLREYVETFQAFFDLYEKVIGAVNNKDSQELKIHLKAVTALRTSEDLDFVLEDVDQLLNESVDGAERVRDIVSGLRNFARLDEAEVKEADINEGILSTLKVIWNAIKYKAEVVQDLGEIPSLVCYPAQLNQVFMNLLTNAAQAMDDRGEICVRTRFDGDNIVIEIEDNGKGISPEHLDKLFDPFFTTKPVGTGTGLGLAISHGIVEKHNGKISVESELGKGTTFIISLPVQGGAKDV